MSKESRDYLRSIQSRGWRCSLSEIQRAVETLGNPQNRFKSIHVAGTNGKGSVSAMCASILETAGLKTGLFISPHLIDVRERITINGKEIPKKIFSEMILGVMDQLEKKSVPPIELTFFEFLMALCFQYLSSEKADVLVAETGLGGRFDATNVLQSDVAVITQIGFDHMEQLGNTIEKIAGEKAGIIKKSSGVVSAANDHSAMSVIRKRAFELGCPLIETGRDFSIKNVNADLTGTIFDYEGTRVLTRVRTNLLGSHQAENAATAIAACDVFAHQQEFELRDEDIRKGLQNVSWPGRLDIVSRKPFIMLDCAHNPSAVKRALQSLEDLKVGIDTLVYSASKDKDYRAVASLLFPKAKRIILTKYGSERAADPEILASLPETRGKNVLIIEAVSDAIEKAKEITPKDEKILVIGSIFLVGDALSWLRYGVAGDFGLAGINQSGTPKS